MSDPPVITDVLPAAPPVGRAHRLGRGSILRVSGLIASTAASLLLVPLLVRALGDRTYGLWTLATTFTGYYSLLELGLGTAVTRHVASALGARNEREANEIYSTALVVYCGLGAIVLLVSIVAAAVCGLFLANPADAGTFRAVVSLLGLSIACSFPIRVLMGVLNANLRFDLTAGADLITILVRTGLILAVIFAHLGIVYLAWAVLIASIPNWFLNYLSLRHTLPYLRWRRDLFQPLAARKLFSYASVSFIAGIADTLRFRVDSFVIAGFIGLAAVTHYNIAGSLAGYYLSLSIAAMGILVPVFSQKQGENAPAEIRRTFFLGTKIGIIFASFIGWGLIAWGRPFIARWMGPAYLDAYPPLVALALGCTIAQWQIASPLLLYGLSRHKFYAVFNWAEGAANLVLSLILVKHYGLLGVALGTLFPLAATKLLVQPVYTCRVLQIPVTHYIRASFRTLAGSAVALIVPTFLTWRFVGPTYPRLIAVGAASAVTYLCCVWMLALRGEDGRIIKRALLPTFSFGSGKQLSPR